MSDYQGKGLAESIYQQTSGTYNAKAIAQSILQQTTSPKDPCPDIKASYALFQTIRQESFRKQPPRDTKPSYMDRVHTLSTFKHPYAEKGRGGLSSPGFYGKISLKSDLGTVATSLYKGIASSTLSSGSASSYQGVNSSSAGYRSLSGGYRSTGVYNG